jgi:hypothetical protein
MDRRPVRPDVLRAKRGRKLEVAGLGMSRAGKREKGEQ